MWQQFTGIQQQAPEKNIHSLWYPVFVAIIYFFNTTSLINFLHSATDHSIYLHNCWVWQSLSITSLQVFFGLPLHLTPSTSKSMHFFRNTVCIYSVVMKYTYQTDDPRWWRHRQSSCRYSSGWRHGVLCGDLVCSECIPADLSCQLSTNKHHLCLIHDH